MTSRTVHNFERAVHLVMEGNTLGCDFIHLYYGKSPAINAFINYLLCFYCPCKPPLEVCYKSVKYLYDIGKLSPSEYAFLIERLKKWSH